MSNTTPEYDALSPREKAKEHWWDAYKEAHDFRPRGIDTSAWSASDFDAAADELYAYAATVREAEKALRKREAKVREATRERRAWARWAERPTEGVGWRLDRA